MKRIVIFFLMLAFALPVNAFALTEKEVSKKIQDLNNQVEVLQKQMKKMKTQEMFQDKRVAAVEEKAGDGGSN